MTQSTREKANREYIAAGKEPPYPNDIKKEEATKEVEAKPIKKKKVRKE